MRNWLRDLSHAVFWALAAASFVLAWAFVLAVVHAHASADGDGTPPGITFDEPLWGGDPGANAPRTTTRPKDTPGLWLPPEPARLILVDGDGRDAQRYGVQPLPPNYFDEPRPPRDCYNDGGRPPPCWPGWGPLYPRVPEYDYAGPPPPDYPINEFPWPPYSSFVPPPALYPGPFAYGAQRGFFFDSPRVHVWVRP